MADLEMSDWQPAGEEKQLTRSTSYIKPLSGSIGPKQTKCHITDEHQHRDYDDYISMLTTTKTPDVPSGGVFSVKTRTCIMWAGSNSSKVVVTTTVEWTGKSWVKGIIEKSAIDGQKQYHDDLEKDMKAYMKEHPEEFGNPDAGDDEGEGEGGDKDKKGEAPTEAAAYAAEQRKERQNADYSMIQGGFDKVISGAGSIASGLGACFKACSSIVSDTPLSKEVAVGLVIALLVVSNVYTFFAYRSNEVSDARRAKRLSRGAGVGDVSAGRIHRDRERGNGDEDLEEAIRAMIRREKEREASPLDEAREIARLLEGVESRLSRLRSTVHETVSDVGAAKSIEELD